MIYHEDYYNKNFLANLKSVYGSYQVMDNGVIKAGSSSSNVIYIDTHYILTDSDIYTCYPGDGGSTGDYQYQQLVKNINNVNSPHFLLMTANSHDRDHAIHQAKQFIKACGAQVTWNEVAFSGGGGSALDRMDSFLGNNPDAQVGDIILSDVDLYNCYSKCSNIKKSGATIYVIIPKYSNGYCRDFDTGVLKTVEPLYKKGLNVKIIKSPIGDHVGNFNLTVDKNGIMSSIISGKLLDEYEVYDYQGNGKYTKTTSISSKSKNKKVTCQVRVVDAAITYDNLSKINDNINLTSASGNISSDYQYVASAMNKLRSQIKSYNFAGKSVQSFGSPTGIPGCIAGYINAYYNAIGAFMSSLEQETKAVISIAQAYVDMDNDYSNGAEKIGEGQIIVNPNPTSDAIENEEETSENEDYSGGGSYGGGGGGYYGGGGGIIPPASATQSNDNNQQENETISFDLEDGGKLVIDTAGKDIVDLKYKYEYSSAEEANNMYNEILQKYKDKPYVDDIKIDDKSIDVIFKKEYFKDMTIDEIKDKYLLGDE